MACQTEQLCSILSKNVSEVIIGGIDGPEGSLEDSNRITDGIADSSKAGIIPKGMSTSNNFKESLKRSTVHIFCDSMGRSLSRLCHQENSVSGIDFLSFVYPGSSLEFVYSQVMNYCKKDYVKNCDWIYIICGTNNFSADESNYEILKFQEYFSRIVTVLGNKNVILSTIPYRYDLWENSVINLKIKFVNKWIRETVSKYNIQYIDLYLLDRSCHTGHGLHLNFKGKRFLAKKIVTVVSKHNKGSQSFPVFSEGGEDWLVLDECCVSLCSDSQRNGGDALSSRCSEADVVEGPAGAIQLDGLPLSSSFESDRTYNFDSVGGSSPFLGFRAPSLRSDLNIPASPSTASLNHSTNSISHSVPFLELAP